MAGTPTRTSGFTLDEVSPVWSPDGTEFAWWDWMNSPDEDDQ